jgi:hypothetical protein
MKINELEESRLRELYEQANENDDDQSWQLVRDYYKLLGKKYGFDPRRVMINTKGEVTKRSNEAVYVVFDSKQGIPVAVYRSKKQAMEHTMTEGYLHWDEVNLY